MSSRNLNRQPTKDTALQWIYDIGFAETAKLFKITEDRLEEIVGLKVPYIQYKYNTVNYHSLPDKANEVAEIINKNYNQLYSKIVKDKDTLKLSQTEEDLFQMAFIRTVEHKFKEVTPEIVLTHFLIEFKTLKKYNSIQHLFSMRHNILPLEYKNEDGEWFIPYADIKETTEE